VHGQSCLLPKRLQHLLVLSCNRDLLDHWRRRMQSATSTSKQQVLRLDDLSPAQLQRVSLCTVCLIGYDWAVLTLALAHLVRLLLVPPSCLLGVELTWHSTRRFPFMMLPS
jgi:hypothetical protein